MTGRTRVRAGAAVTLVLCAAGLAAGQPVPPGSVPPALPPAGPPPGVAGPPAPPVPGSLMQLPPGMFPSAVPGARPLDELHRLTGVAPAGSVGGDSAVHYNPTPPEVPDHTQVGAQLGNNSLGGGIATNFARPQTGGTAAVYQLFPHWRAGWDKGFVIAPVDPAKTPFELRINGTFQARYTGFAREREYWVNNTGQVNQVLNRNDVQMVRSLMAFSGFVYDERITYDVWVGGTTTIMPDIFILPALGYKVSKAFYPRVGMGRLPFGAEFVIEDFTTQFVDRSMATTFFMADFAQGVWATGELVENRLKYWSMAGTGTHTFATPVDQLDNRFVFAHMWILDPIGQYGSFISDLEYHEEPALRLVQSYLYAPERGQPNGQPFGESGWPRLSDGTLVTAPGALAPGVTVNTFTQYGFAQSVQFKYRGLSLFGEWLGQWYQGFHAVGGAIPKDRLNIFNHGFTAQAGYFVVPKRFELMARTSHVFGPQKQDAGAGEHGQEYSLGTAYYHKGNQYNKVVMDFQYLKNTPADLSFPGYVAGQTGFAARLQWQLGF